MPMPSGEVWELDFCSRPIVDEKGKKLWELLIVSPSKDFVYSVFLDSRKINSTEVGLRHVVVL